MGVRLGCLFVTVLIAPSSLQARRLPVKTYTTADGLCRAALKSWTGTHVFSTLSSNLIQLS
jgi:hypothetical protein